MLNKNQNLSEEKTWGGKRKGAGRPALDLDPQTKKYYDAYMMQRLHAGYRRIDWQFTFDEWLAWWGDDITNRGRNNGKLVMARYNDTGPYHPDNVRKATKNQNSKEKHWGKPVSAEGQLFDSLTNAAKHFDVTVEAIRFRIKTRPDEYYYVQKT